MAGVNASTALGANAWHGHVTHAKVEEAGSAVAVVGGQSTPVDAVQTVRQLGHRQRH
jgi:NADPH-dependent glutamate synthase beta subunit-like oxidoreductase